MVPKHAQLGEMQIKTTLRYILPRQRSRGKNQIA